jgi:PAS domain S-box-containing protein
VVGVVQDVTESFRRSHAEKAFFDLSPELLAVTDFEGNFQSMSPSWTQRLGWSEAELREKGLLGLGWNEYAKEIEESLHAVASGKSSHQMECQVSGRDGSSHWLLWNIFGDSKLGIAFVSAVDITRRKRESSELLDAKLRAEDASRAKSDFLAIMSHELRTPLNPIMGFTQMLIEEIEDEEKREMLRTIVSAGSDLLDIIDQILSFAKMEAGRVEVVEEVFSLKEMIAQKVLMMGGQLQEGKVSFLSNIEFEAPGGEDIEILCDAGKVKRILRNFLSNAAKFTKEGTVRLDVKVGAPSAGRVMTEFRVSDTGMGIAEKDFEKLFLPFSQIDTSSTRRFGGTGLGLSICKQLADLIGGEVFVESKLGVGSTFIFRVLLKIAESKKKSDRAEESDSSEIPQYLASNPSVLLFEDNESNIIYLSRLLEQLGCRVIVSKEGNEAIRLSSSEDLDLILLDLFCPGVDGHDVLKAIREAEKESGGSSRMPVIVITADASPETKKLCFEEGADDFLLKPTRADDFRRLIGKYLDAVENRS